MAVDNPEENPVRVLKKKLADETKRQAREGYFAWRILPLLASWAAVTASIKLAAGDTISMGVALTIYFAGAAVCVVWLSRRARQHNIEG